MDKPVDATRLSGHKREAIRRIGTLGSVATLDAETMKDLLAKQLISVRQSDGQVVLTDGGKRVFQQLTGGQPHR